MLLAALLFGTTGTARALADLDASASTVGLARVLLGGAVLAACALATRRRPGERGEATPRTGVLSALPAPVVVAGGAAGVLAYQPTFFAGTSGGVAVGTVVALGSAPLVTGVVDAVLRRRRPEGRWWGATGLALVGLVLVAGLGAPGAGPGPSVLWAVAAGASYAVYTVTGKELLDRGWTPAGVMGAQFGVAAAVALPALVVVGGAGDLTGPGGLLLVAWLGVATVAVAYLLFGWGLARLPATTVATLTLAEPLCATLLGVGLLGEDLSPAVALGLAVLASSLVVLTVPLRRGRPRAAVAA